MSRFEMKCISCLRFLLDAALKSEAIFEYICDLPVSNLVYATPLGWVSAFLTKYIDDTNTYYNQQF